MGKTIGILGGMGPMATVDFVQKVISQTPASCDQDHVPLLIHSVPQIPDRTASLLSAQESPLPALQSGLKTLVEAKVACIAIPCNTAHYWYEPLTQVSSVPILHIAKACSDQLVKQGIKSVGLMATDGTLKAGFYPKELGARGIEVTLPEPQLQQQVMQGIYAVKSGEVEKGGKTLELCMQQMLASGVERVILGCTEIPFALDSINSGLCELGMDATKALAAACVEFYQTQQQATKQPEPVH